MKISLGIGNTSVVLSVFISFAVCSQASQPIPQLGPRCSQIMIERASHAEALAKLMNLRLSAQILETHLEVNPRRVTPDFLRHYIQIIENNLESYLTLSGFTFDKIPSHIQFAPPGGFSKHDFWYSIYKVIGSRWGDQNSRLVAGALKLAEGTKDGLTITIDPLYDFRGLNSLGHYTVPSSRITLGTESLVQAVDGRVNTLRHEVQHFIEQTKIDAGRNSLGRVSLQNQARTPNQDIYSSFFRLDEAETHLRDLRSLTNTATQQALEKSLNGILQTDEIKDLHQQKKAYKQHTIKLIRRFKLEALATFAKIRDKVPMMVRRDHLTGSVLAIYRPMSPPYDQVQFELKGMLQQDQVHDLYLIKNLVDRIMVWTKSRLDAIEAEVENIEFR